MNTVVGTYFFDCSDTVSVTNHKPVTLDSLDLTWRRLEIKGKKTTQQSYYRPQGKVMCSEASVCSQGGAGVGYLWSHSFPGSRASLAPCPFKGVGYLRGRVLGSRVSGG